MVARQLIQPRTRRACVLAVALGTVGCYEYVPIPMASVSPQEDVRVRISNAGASRLVDQFGIYTTQLDGRLSRPGADSIALSVPIAREYQGVLLGNSRQTLLLSRADVLQVERRQLSRARTAVVTVGTLVAFGLLAREVAQLGDPNPSSQGPPPPPPPSSYRGMVPFTIP